MSRANLHLFLVLILFLAATLIRFYHFPDRITFGPEQAMSLLISADYLDKPSLLGQPYFRVTTSGHQLFTAPFFNYALVPLLLLFRFNPLPVTAFFSLLNLFTAAILYRFASRHLPWLAAFLATLIFLFNSRMIFHSLFIWILNFLPLLGLLNFYFLYRFFISRFPKFAFGVGFVAGLAFGIEYFYLFTAAVIFTLLIYSSRTRLKTALVFAAGGSAASLPLTLFDLRHDFYHTRTLWQYFLDTLSNSRQSFITYYHFLNFWPIFVLLGGFILYRMFQKKHTLLSLILLAAYFYSNLFSSHVSFSGAVGMPPGLTLAKLEEASAAISADAPDRFNVASLLDFNTRAHPLRYFLRFYYHRQAEAFDNYSSLSALYVLADSDTDINLPTNYELRSFYPYRVTILDHLDDRYLVYKLTK